MVGNGVAPTSSTTKAMQLRHEREARKKKNAPGGAFSQLAPESSNQIPRQEPGRNFEGTVVTNVLPPTSVVFPQTHANRGNGVAAVVSICTLPVATGIKVTTLPSMAVSPMPWTVAFTAPRASVSTFATYFDVAVELSQPQAPAAGKLADEFD